MSCWFESPRSHWCCRKGIRASKHRQSLSVSQGAPGITKMKFKVNEGKKVCQEQVLCWVPFSGLQDWNFVEFSLYLVSCSWGGISRIIWSDLLYWTHCHIEWMSQRGILDGSRADVWFIHEGMKMGTCNIFCSTEEPSYLWHCFLNLQSYGFDSMYTVDQSWVLDCC